MAQVTLEQMKDAFRKKDRAELEELALASSLAHARVCALSSPEGDVHPHAPEAVIRERIRGKSTDDLVDILAREALVTRAAAA